MQKKAIIIMAAVLLLFGSSVWALDDNGETPLTPGNPLYNATRAIENAQYAMATDPEEKIMIQNEFSERRLTAMEDVGDTEDFEELLAAYAEHEQELEGLLEGLNEPDFKDVYDLVIESSKQKSDRLGEIANNENLPEGAREGVQKALDNQEMAMRKLEDALARAREAYDNARSRPDQDDGVTTGPPEGIEAGPPEGINPGPPDDPGPPEGVVEGRPNDVGPPANNNAPGGSNHGGGERP